MPLYDYQCPKCGEVQNVWAKMDDTTIKHDACGHWMRRLISATYINPDIQPYLEENAGHTPVLIKSRRHRTQVLKELGLSIR